MTICDVSAVDKLLDFYGEYLMVKYNKKIYELVDLRDFLEDNNISMSIDDCVVNQNGIFKNNDHVVSILNLDTYNKDDLIKI